MLGFHYILKCTTGRSDEETVASEGSDENEQELPEMEASDKGPAAEEESTSIDNEASQSLNGDEETALENSS
jgi:hypothetical protein